MDFFHEHYVRADPSGNIIAGWSTGPHRGRQPSEDDILINDRGGYQFRIFPDGEENPPLRTMDGIPLYKWVGSAVARRSENEIETDRAVLRAKQDRQERERVANATETVLLELAAEHEERLCLLEMGVM